jgi:putative flippase GtrA
MGVSVITTVLSLATILLATVVFGVAAAIANIIATTIATVPSYHLNRRWTWGRRDHSDLWREVVPFWVLSFCGLALSTLTVGIADSWAAHLHLTTVLHSAAVLVGHLGGFGVLWVLQFVLLDHVLFARDPHDPDDDARGALPARAPVREVREASAEPARLRSDLDPRPELEPLR